MYPIIYVVNEKDNVGTALDDLLPDKEYDVYIEGKGISYKLRTQTYVKKWYKVSVKKIHEEDDVIKFGYTIGIAISEIPAGCVVHIGHFRYSLTRPDFYTAIATSNILGKSLRKIEKGDSIRVNINVKVSHQLLKELPTGTILGYAVTDLPHNMDIFIGNLKEKPMKYGWNPEYAKLVRRFYKFLKSGFITFTR